MPNPEAKSPADTAARVQVSQRVVLWLDEPLDWSQPVRRLRISGWVVVKNGEPLVALRATLRGRTFAGRFDRYRPEVAEYSRISAAPAWCGFTVDLRVPFGKGRLELQVARADGVWIKAYARDLVGPLFITAKERRSWPNDDSAFTRGSFSCWFDEPADWSRKARHLHLSGWCIDTRGREIFELRARLRGRAVRVHYGILRPDVSATLTGGLSTLRSGFSADLIVPPGPSTLLLEARTEEGWEAVFIRRVRGPLFWSSRLGAEAVGHYAEWIALHDRLTGQDRARIATEIAGWDRRPLVSVLLPAYNTDPRWLRRALRSVQQQLYPHWELCAVDDGSTNPEVWKILQVAARKDPRIKIQRRSVNGHIVAASNDALARATGEYIALLDHDDELASTALYCAAHELNRDRNLQLLYSDEDKLDAAGRRCDPYFKPDWNPDFFLTQNYISHLSIYAADLVRTVGGFREGSEGSQDYDLTLRCVERIAATQIHHIPHVLYHWRAAAESTATAAAAKPYAHEAALRAVQEHLDRRQTSARVEAHYANYQRVIYPSPAGNPLVSIIIPTRDRAALLRQTIESVKAKTAYSNIEFVIVDNDSCEPETLAYLSSLGAADDASVITDRSEFNYSKLNNLGAAHARGTFLALLNNDLEVINPDWLTEMVSQAARPEIGAVGARLWYPDGRMQHGGVILGVGGVASHAHHHQRREHGYFARPHLAQNISAVTGACMVVRKETYERLGGFDEEHLAVAFNDVDFCLRLRAHGLRVVWTPHAELIHHESASRGLEDTKTKQERFLSEVAYMHAKWGRVLEEDPFYNPNLSLVSDQQWKLAFPPRAAKPWRQNAAERS